MGMVARHGSCNLGPLLRCRLHKARPRDSSGRMTFVSPVQLVPKVHQNQCFHIRSPKQIYWLLHLVEKVATFQLASSFKPHLFLRSKISGVWPLDMNILDRKNGGNNSEKSVVYKEFSVWKSGCGPIQYHLSRRKLWQKFLWTFRHFIKDFVHRFHGCL